MTAMTATTAMTAIGRVVAIDTSSAVTSAALLVQGRLEGFAWHDDARGHLEALSGLLAQVLGRPRAADLVVCGVGPGPYSGLRVGLATARTLGLAWQVPVLGVCSLDAIAAAAVSSGTARQGFSVAQDARRREEYRARYDASGHRLAGPSISAIQDRGPGPWFGSAAPGAQAGPGGATFAELRFPSAAWIARIAFQALAALPVSDVPRVVAEVLAQRPADLARHGTDTGATERALTGHVLLPPRPLYVRRPDVHQGGR